MKTKKPETGFPKLDTADSRISRPDAADPEVEISSPWCLILFEREGKDIRPESPHDHQALINAGLDFISRRRFFRASSWTLSENTSDKVEKTSMSSDPNLNLHPQCPGTRQDPQRPDIRRPDSSPLPGAASLHNALPHGRLDKDNNGKPFLVNYPNIHISISDSGEYTVCAFAPVPVGIDLQEIRFLHKTPLQLAHRFFTSTEYEMIRSAGDKEEQADLFCRLWTIKESCLKCTGQGLGGGLDTFWPDFSKGQVFPSSAHPSDPPFPSLFFTELTAPKGYHLTIASPACFCKENIRYLNVQA